MSSGAGAGGGGLGGSLSWKAHDGVVLSADWCPLSLRIVSGGEDGRFKVWDALGRPIYASPAGEHVVSSVAWAPNGLTFAVASARALRVCDAAGVTLATGALPGSAVLTGGISALAWSPDNTVVALGSAAGALSLVAPVGRREMSPQGYEATLVEPSRVIFSDTEGEGEGIGPKDEAAEFRERVADLSVGFGHALVATSTQIHVFSRSQGWATALHVVDTPRAPTVLLLQSSRGFAALDATGALSFFSYDCRPVATQPKLPVGSVRPELSSRSSISVSPDSLAILDRADGKSESMA